MKRLLLVVTVLILKGWCGNVANPETVDLMPTPVPQSFVSDIDHPVPFDQTTTVTLACPDTNAVHWLSEHLSAWYGVYSPRVVSGEASLPLRDGEEAYAVSAEATGVRICARTLAGVRWAAYSLRLVAMVKRGTIKTAGYILPTLSISDAPHLGFRCVHLCWFPEVTNTQIERAIRLAGLLKFNYAILEPWGMYKSVRHPWWSWPEAKMTKEEIHRLVAVARDVGVTLLPQIPSLGHAAIARACTMKHTILDLQPEYEPLFEPGGWNWCLTNPETQRVLRDLIEEALEDFEHPPFIHLGCDEGQQPGCPDCRKRPYGELVSEHIAALAAFAKEHGARSMIWHDMMIKRGDPRWEGFVATGDDVTVRLVDLLPRDIVICDWQYSYKDMKERRTEWPTLRYFAEKGFPVAACPWMNYYSMRAMADVVASSGGFGYIQTTWHHLRGKDWVMMYRYGAAAAWGGGLSARTKQLDVNFANALRCVGRDMKVADYLDTGTLNYQVPPAWWIDNN